MKTLPILLLLPLLACSSGAATSAATGMPMRLDDGSAAAFAHLRLDKVP